MKPSPIETLPMFDMEPTPRFTGEPRKRAARKPNPDRITWTSYKAKTRQACDDCMRDLVESGGGPVARDAKYRRLQHGADRLLCTAHAQVQRSADGLPALKAG